MKQKVYLGLGLLLLAGVVIILLFDLWGGRSPESVNPWDYQLDSLRQSDSLTAYQEILSFRTQADTIHGISVGKGDKIYVVGNKSLEVFSEQGREEMNLPLPGEAFCIHVTTSGDLLVGLEDQVIVLNKTGEKLASWKSARENALFTSIDGDDNNVYCTDAGNLLVHHYDRQGKLLNLIGRKDPEAGIPGFVVPSPYFDLALDKEGMLWVANPGRHSLEQYAADGKLLSSWGFASTATEGFCGCCNPSHFTFLDDGFFVTSEKGIERVKVYDRTGKFVALVAIPGSFDEGTRGLDLATDSRGRILVLDPVRKMIRIFVKKEQA